MYLWIDTETTGLIPGKHTIIQIGAFITEEFLGDPIDTFNSVGSAEGFKISKKALEVNGITKKELKRRQSPRDLFIEFREWMGKYVDRYNRKDKLIPVGYNVKFDIDMLFGMALKLRYPYLGAYISGSAIDILSVVRFQAALGALPSSMRSHKLGDVCAALEIDLPSHDAMDDIIATYEIVKRIVK